MGERRSTKGLELWCRKMTEGYPGVKVDNMTTSWRDGLAFCAIIHHFRPDLIEFSKLNKDDVYYNNELAFTIAERHLGIPALLEPEDMVELNVPDRLSILTYLSQFYHTFVVTQGSPSRILPKRPAPPSERGIVSPASTSPPTKMAIHCGIARREPCAKCGLPVFIAERLNVGKQLFHRTCFRCARCNSQLTLANYYETENSEYCCETCPDEEEQTIEIEKCILNRSLSDEEKSAGLKKTDESDGYSSIFESALENTNDKQLTKYYTLNNDQNSEFIKARSQFIQSQIGNTDEDTDSGDDEPPELPKTKPPDVVQCIETSFINNSENISGENIDDINTVQFSYSSFPAKELVNSISVSDQPKTASTQLEETHNFVTKETNQVDDGTNNSLVKDRLRLFEKHSSENHDEIVETVQITDVVGKQSRDVEEKHEEMPFIKEEINTTTDESFQLIKTENLDEKTFETEEENVKSEKENISCDEHITETIIVEEKSHISISSDSVCEEKNETKDSVITISDSSNEIIKNNELVTSNENYPDDLNPFGDDSEGENKIEESNLKKSKSLNPFGDDDEFEDEIQPSPKPAVRKKIKPTASDLEIKASPEHLSSVKITRISINPFDKDNSENVITKPPLPDNRKKVVPAPRISLNPFWSDGEEPEDEESRQQKPVPLPRTSNRSSLDSNEPKRRESGLSGASTATFGSNTSLSSNSSTINQTIKKKKPAPKPPSKESSEKTDSPLSSLNASPSPSVQQSPKSTTRIRKNKKAPLPPSFITSTPAQLSTVEVTEDLSPIHSALKTYDSNWENEKIAKDEMNRNRQSQNLNNTISPTSSENSSSLSVPNKSTYGKWKRRKGPAPSRPVPQRRTIKALPLAEIRRELDVIEIQQQGLEKQGVRLEQIIRERCEGPNANEDSALSPEVEDMVLQLFELVNEKNELFRKQAELMYLRRQQRLEEEHADVEYQIRCLMLQPETSKTDADKAREEELINRLVEIVERRNEIIECLEMDRIREAEEDDGINNHLNQYTLKRDEDKRSDLKQQKTSKKEKKKHKKEKRFKLKGHKIVDMDKDVDECESSSNSKSSPVKDKKKKKFNIF